MTRQVWLGERTTTVKVWRFNWPERESQELSQQQRRTHEKRENNQLKARMLNPATRHDHLESRVHTIASENCPKNALFSLKMNDELWDFDRCAWWIVDSVSDNGATSCLADGESLWIAQCDLATLSYSVSGVSMILIRHSSPPSSCVFFPLDATMQPTLDRSVKANLQCDEWRLVRALRRGQDWGKGEKDQVGYENLPAQTWRIGIHSALTTRTVVLVRLKGKTWSRKLGASWDSHEEIYT